MTDGTDKQPSSDGAAVTALRELGEAGGAKRYIECRFGFNVLALLVEARLVIVDDGSPQRAMVRLTPRGRTLIVDGWG